MIRGSCWKACAARVKPAVAGASQIFWFFAVFGGAGYCSARRAKENSPAIHRWVWAARSGRVPEGRQNHGLRLRLAGILSSLRDYRAADFEPSDKSLGYFRSSLRDSRPAAPRLRPFRGREGPAPFHRKGEEPPFSIVPRPRRLRLWPFILRLQKF